MVSEEYEGDTIRAGGEDEAYEGGESGFDVCAGGCGGGGGCDAVD